MLGFHAVLIFGGVFTAMCLTASLSGKSGSASFLSAAVMSFIYLMLLSWCLAALQVFYSSRCLCQDKRGAGFSHAGVTTARIAGLRGKTPT